MLKQFPFQTTVLLENLTIQQKKMDSEHTFDNDRYNKN